MMIGSNLFIILAFTFFGEIGICWCNLQVHPIVKNIKEVLDKKMVSERCAKVLTIFIERLDDGGDNDIWAIKLLDATSKVPVDPLSYNFGDLGHFQECIEIESKQENIIGKYCLGTININASVAKLYSQQSHDKDLKQLVSILTGDNRMVDNMIWAMCLPSNCTVEDTTLLMNKLQPFGFGVSDVICQTVEDVYPKLTTDALIGISILSLLALVILISTSYDIYCQGGKTAHPSFVAFSFYTNGKKLFHYSTRSSSLSCLDGIRVLSLIWVVCIHTWTVSRKGSVFDNKVALNISNSIVGIIILNGDFAVDTFLIVGGTLVTYVYFKKYNGQSLTFSAILRHYVHRIVRLTPALAGAVLVSATLLRYMGSGPKWPDIVMGFEESCKKYWWSTLLFIENIVNVEEMCVRESWYLDVDMQLYIFSPLIFWILSKYSKTGMTILSFATILSILLGFYRACKDEQSFDYGIDYYNATETRAPPWIMGTMLGYILTKKELTQISLSKKITLPIWILTFAILLVSVFSSYGTVTPMLLPKINNPFFIVLVRPAFAAAVGWIIWACTTNHGGIINDILSLSIFQFLNKFVYSMYLTHLTILFMIHYSSHTSFYVSNFNVAYWFWGIYMFSFGMSIIWILVFEMPITAIEGIILSASKTKHVTIKEEITKEEEITKKEEIIKNNT